MSDILINRDKFLRLIEENHLEHFKFLPARLGYNVDHVHDTIIINSELRSSMFNIAYGFWNKGDLEHNCENNYNGMIQKVKNAFDNLPFAWWMLKQQCDDSLQKVLLDSGFTIETTEHAMICDLKAAEDLDQKTSLQIKPVLDKDTMQDFISVLETYDTCARVFYEKCNELDLSLNERLFVGYTEDDNVKNVVIIGILFLNDNSAGIFSLITKEEERGKGYGTDMMKFLLRFAKDINCDFATLSASSDSGYRIYERLGFEKIGEFDCFEYSGE